MGCKNTEGEGQLEHGALEHGVLGHGALEHGALGHGALEHGFLPVVSGLCPTLGATNST